AALVTRHGSMVLAACRRVLGNPADAEDACQAAFLVLARKAESARWQPSVAGWLYATARQVALNARTARTRRVKHEGAAAAGAAPPRVAALAQGVAMTGGKKFATAAVFAAGFGLLVLAAGVGRLPAGDAGPPAAPPVAPKAGDPLPQVLLTKPDDPKA